MRKAEKRRIGEQKQAINRAESARLGLVAQKRDREKREKAKERAENPVVVRPSKKKGPSRKKFGPVTTRQNQFQGPGLSPGS